MLIPMSTGLVQGGGGVVWASDLGAASYDSVSFNVSSQDSNPTGIYIRDDGLKFYVIGYSSDRVHQYSMSTAWDLSTASYDSANYLETQTAFPTDLHFSSDGATMYVVGSGTVYQYTLSTPWVITSASYDSVSFSVSTQESAPEAIFFSGDGAKLYALGPSSDTVYQYSMSTEWDLSTASYDSVSFSVGSQESEPQGLFFATDGSQLFIVGSGSKVVYQYSMSTEWDLSTASYDSVSFSISGQANIPAGLFFKTNGAKMYVLDRQNRTIHQYTSG